MLGAGPLLVEGCMRPWAERLIDLARPGPGDRCLDVLSESDVLARRLGRVVGPDGVVESTADPAAAPGTWTVAVSLFGLAAATDPAGMLTAMAARVDHRGGRLAAVAWAGAAGAPHEAAVQAGLEGVGLSWPAQAAELRAGDPAALAPLPAGLCLGRLADVVRFDGIGHLWAALVSERNPPDAVIAAPAAALAEARRACAARLAAHTAADGTLRIPVEALLVERAG